MAMGNTTHQQEFLKVLDAEHQRIATRRLQAGLPEGNPQEDSVGLALSGGGIRSATFNLGLLQAMHHYKVLPNIDYLSTVSGGGYIGSSLTWFMSQLKKPFPFLTTCKDDDASRMLQWLRCHSSYLLPGYGLGLAALVTAVLRGMFINLLVFIPFFIALFFGLTTTYSTACPWLAAWQRSDLFPCIFSIGAVMLAALFLLFVVYALTSTGIRQQEFTVRRKAHVWMGRFLTLTVGLIAVGLVPIVYFWLLDNFPKFWHQALSSVTFSGVIALVAGWMGRTRKNETQGWVAWLLRIGLVLILFGLLIWLYHFALYLHGLNTSFALTLVIIGLAASLLTGWLSNINMVSMNRYYRDRLLEAFLPEFKTPSDPEPCFSLADKCYLHEIPQTEAPYHIINTNMITVGSDDPRLRARGGENFIFSSAFVGSDTIGYVATKDFDFGAANLATAMAISGAAVDPNTGATRSRPLAFIMTLLNIRLGYWIRNPQRPTSLSKENYRKYSRPFWHLYMLREMFGWEMDEKGTYLHLSDGGHFENLGIYELVRRKCRYIIVADAGADPNWTFSDLARACERIRADFCAHTYINTQPLHPDPKNRLSEKANVLGTICYEDGGKSTLLFLKTTMFPGLPEDIYGYQRANPTFPDQTTADQFFDELQFEAYRELGFNTGRAVFEHKETFADIFL